MIANYYPIAFDNNTYLNHAITDLRSLPGGGIIARFDRTRFTIPVDLQTNLRLIYAFTGYVQGDLFRGGLFVSADTAHIMTHGDIAMSIKISGNHRVIGIYLGEKDAWVTLKDKADGSQLKCSVSLPLPPVVKDDALIELNGSLLPRLYNGNMSLAFQGEIKAVSEK